MIKKSILLVDDDQDTRDIYYEFLNEAGFQVDTAPDGAEGLTKILANTYDLILLDIMMPKMDGLDVLSKFHAEPADKKPRQGPILMLSALDQDQIVHKAIGLGAAGFLHKAQLTPEDLLAQINRYLGLSSS